MRTILYIIAILLVPTHLFAAEFTRALAVGMRGEDVRTLQQFLNSDSTIRVAETGAGSLGNETTYFGPATKQAVIKFQEKYSSDILTPLGLMKGTGFFGEKTRMKISTINDLQNKRVIPRTYNSIPTAKSPSMFEYLLTKTATKTAESGSKISTPQFPLLEKTEFTITENGVESREEFYKRLTEKGATISFSEQEYNSLKKENDRILSLEELIEIRKKGNDSEEIVNSFNAWAELNKKMAFELKKLPITDAVFKDAQEIASWYQYQYSVANRLRNDDLTLKEIEILSQEYKMNADYHNALFRENTGKIGTKQQTFKESVEALASKLFKKAEAFTCGAFSGSFYFFGGYTSYYSYCNDGMVVTITTPCGGNIYFSWAIIALNPYNYHNIYTPSVAVLGRSEVLTAYCQLGVSPYATYSYYEAMATIFYGTGGI